MLRRGARVALLLSVAAGSVAWLHAQQRNTRDSLTTQDYVDIGQLYARYNHAIDDGDAEGYAALFTPDGSFNNNNGHDALVAFIKNRNGANLRHWNTNLVITGTPEGASGSVYLMFLNVGVDPPVVTGAGKYEDTLVRTPQGWRFKKRVNRREGPPAQAPTATPR